MDRLVTDNPQNNVEVMMNLAFVKDKEVWIRGGGPDGEDCTLIEFQKRLCKNRDECSYECADFDELPWDSVENIGDVLMDCSMDGCPHGTAYFIAIQAAELRERLRKYENDSEPVTPKARINKGGFKYEYCGKCGHQLPAGWPKFCDNCGKAVKRE